MKILITICARGGSKGVPGKNIRLICGKPLIGYTIQAAKRFSKEFDTDISLSTDDIEIRQVASQFDINTEYIRPEYLATDVAGKIDTIADVLYFEEKLNGKRYDYILDLDVTSPLRTTQDLLDGFEILKSNDTALNLFSVNPAGRNPYFNMVEQDSDGYYKTIKKLSEGVFSRQSAPKVYDMNASFYFYRREFFDLELKAATTQRSLVYIMPHICFDLDHPIDFEFLSYLLESNKLDFKI